MLQVRQRRMIYASVREGKKQHAQRFRDAMEERGSCCKRENPPKSLEGLNTEVR